jgi:hypothetical protein
MNTNGGLRRFEISDFRFEMEGKGKTIKPTGPEASELMNADEDLRRFEI